MRKLAGLREKCLKALKRVDVRVNYECRQCLYDDLMVTIEGNVSGGGKGI